MYEYFSLFYMKHNCDSFVTFRLSSLLIKRVRHISREIFVAYVYLTMRRTCKATRSHWVYKLCSSSKVHKPCISDCHTPSSEPFRFYSYKATLRSEVRLFFFGVGKKPLQGSFGFTTFPCTFNFF
jgi:hypothetical protein